MALAIAARACLSPPVAFDMAEVAARSYWARLRCALECCIQKLHTKLLLEGSKSMFAHALLGLARFVFAPCMDMHGFALVYIYICIYKDILGIYQEIDSP